jgi:hypothetical protein
MKRKWCIYRKDVEEGLGMVTHTYNSSYCGGRDGSSGVPRFEASLEGKVNKIPSQPIS